MVWRKYDSSESRSFRAASRSEMPESEGEGVISHCSLDMQYLLMPPPPPLPPPELLPVLLLLLQLLLAIVRLPVMAILRPLLPLLSVDFLQQKQNTIISSETSEFWGVPWQKGKGDATLFTCTQECVCLATNRMEDSNNGLLTWCPFDCWYPSPVCAEWIPCYRWFSTIWNHVDVP